MPTIPVISPPSKNDRYGTVGVDMLSNPLTLGDRKVASAVNLVSEEGVMRTRPGFHYHDTGIFGIFQGSLQHTPGRGLSNRAFAQDTSSLVTVVNGKVRLNNAYSGQLDCNPVALCGEYDFCLSDRVEIFAAENWLIFQSPRTDTYFWPGFGCLLQSPGINALESFEDPEIGYRRVYVACGCEDTYDCGQPILPPIGPGNPPTSITSITSIVVPGSPAANGPCCEPDGACLPTPTGFTEGADGTQDAATRSSSHDSFDKKKHTNWLVNSAGLGIYAHGRVHQESGNAIYVSDMLHKRGYLASDDILKMEEQVLQSFGDPLSTNSKMGKLVAIKILPTSNTVNGEGDLIAYYESGVVSYNTFQFPRETRSDADGKTITEGWEMKRMVSHILETISAVGPDSVALLPSDHFFRSGFGLHFLKTVIGEGSFRTESINSISQDVAPLLASDPPQLLAGAACGFWLSEHRLTATVGLFQNGEFSKTPMAKGFVVSNLASTYTEDRTPRFVWEGVWMGDSGIAGIHKFHSIGLNSSGTFGFLASDEDTSLYFAEPRKEFLSDLRDSEFIPIEWSFETGQFLIQSHREIFKITDGQLEGVFSKASNQIRVLVRTDRSSEWTLWKSEIVTDKKGTPTQKYRKSISLGQTPTICREASWFQLRVEGLGFAEIHSLSVEVSEAGLKTGSSRLDLVDSDLTDIFATTLTSPENRWTL